jgi:hypothetical protein
MFIADMLRCRRGKTPAGHWFWALHLTNRTLKNLGFGTQEPALRFRYLDALIG